jgi:hypothetical protein
MLPNFLGLGANRSGSTWIARNLMEHPDVFLPRKKEIHFFDRHYEEGLTYYENEFSDWSGERIVGEVTPQYFHNPVVAPLVAKHLPDVKMFVSLRNPIERAYSQYWRMVATSSIDSNSSFEDVLENNELVLQIGHYYDHLSRFFEYFPQDRILIMIYEDIRSDPNAFLGNLHAFLNVKHEPNSELVDQRINAAASLKSLSRSEPLWYLYRALNRFHLYSLAGKLERYNRRSLPAMKPETRQYLLSYYADQVSKLEELTGRDLENWRI